MRRCAGDEPLTQLIISWGARCVPEGIASSRSRVVVRSMARCDEYSPRLISRRHRGHEGGDHGDVLAIVQETLLALLAEVLDDLLEFVARELEVRLDFFADVGEGHAGVVCFLFVRGVDREEVRGCRKSRGWMEVRADIARNASLRPSGKERVGGGVAAALGLDEHAGRGRVGNGPR